MSSETNHVVLSVLSAVFAGVLGFLWWFFRDGMQRLQTRADKFVDDLGQFKVESAGAHATLASRLTLTDEKVNAVMKKSEEHGAALLLLMPRVAVLEEEERFREKREDPPGPDLPPER